MNKLKSMTERRMQIYACLILGCLLGAVHVLIPGFYETLWKLALSGNVLGLKEYVLSFGYGAMAVSILMIALTNMTGLPSLPILIVNGLVFGLIPGIIVSWIGEFVGCTAGFAVMRTVFRGLAKRIIAKSRRLNRLDSYSSFRTVLIARALPYTPNVVLTALLAASSVAFTEHAIATFIGKLPAVAVEVLLGHDLIHIAEHADRLAAVLAVCIAAYLIYRYKNTGRRE